MKKPISIKLSERLWVYIKDKPNKSRYVEELIKQDIQQAQVKPIVQSVIQELLSNETFFREMGERLRLPDRPTLRVEKVEDTVLAPNLSVGYPCCLKKVPCKHWSFNGADDQWVNILTGEIKDA